jgi:hypothetical protein
MLVAVATACSDGGATARDPLPDASPQPPPLVFSPTPTTTAPVDPLVRRLGPEIDEERLSMLPIGSPFDAADFVRAVIASGRAVYLGEARRETRVVIGACQRGIFSSVLHALHPSGAVTSFTVHTYPSSEDASREWVLDEAGRATLVISDPCFSCGMASRVVSESRLNENLVLGFVRTPPIAIFSPIPNETDNAELLELFDSLDPED